jgi:hypothetical protein
MEEAPGSTALVWCTATVGLYFAARSTSNAEVAVPEADRSWAGSGDIDLDLQFVRQDRT